MNEQKQPEYVLLNWNPMKGFQKRKTKAKMKSEQMSFQSAT